MDINVPEKLDFLYRPKRYKIAYGGRGGYKTLTFCDALLLLGIQNKLKILCAREYMSAVRASVHAALAQQIGALGLEHYYRIEKALIHGRNGTLFDFIGFSRNINSIKSYEGFDILWIEEAEGVRGSHFRKAVLTIRKPRSEIWVSFNPSDEFAHIYSGFVTPHLKTIKTTGYYEDSNIYVVETNLEDNPYPCIVLREESRTLKEKNPKLWEHEFGGEPVGDYTLSLIQPEWFDVAIDAHKKLNFEAIGTKALGFDPADTGDAKALVHRHGPVVTFGRQWGDGELPEAIDTAFSVADSLKADHMIYDEDGLGLSIKVHLAKTEDGKLVQVVPYHGNGKVERPKELYPPIALVPLKIGGPRRKSNKEYFKNRRAQTFRELADKFEATYYMLSGKIPFNLNYAISISSEMEDLDVLKAELVSIKRDKQNSSQYQIQSKKDALSEGVLSYNYADALNMSYAGPLLVLSLDDFEFESEWSE